MQGIYEYEKALGETHTLRAGCSKTEPIIITPPQTPSRGIGRPKFNQLEMVTALTYRIVYKTLHHAIEVGNVSHRAGENTNIMQ